MTTKSNRYLDNQGRVILPAHIRKAMNLNPGSIVEVRLEDDGTIRLRPTVESCAVCGLPIDDKPYAALSEGPERKLICYKCAQEIAKAMIKQL